METAANINEQLAGAAFSNQSGVFDALYSCNTLNPAAAS
jgi:hypothetical protein